MINVFDLKGSDYLFRNVLINDLSQDFEPGKHKHPEHSIFFLNWMKDPL